MKIEQLIPQFIKWWNSYTKPSHRQLQVQMGLHNFDRFLSVFMEEITQKPTHKKSSSKNEEKDFPIYSYQ